MMFGLSDNLVPLLTRGVEALERMAAALEQSARADAMTAELTKQTVSYLDENPGGSMYPR